jgi:phage tail sheath protein FI
LWYALNLYFKNGGSRCYVVSIDNHSNAAAEKPYEAGFKALAAIDEPTLIIMPEAILLTANDFASVCQSALAQCGTLRDRFTILDVKDGDVDSFRTNIGTNYLAYGSAYHPYVNTTLVHTYDETAVKVGDANDAPMLSSLKTTNTSLYNDIKTQLANQRVQLPPSPAMAGIYARTDRDRGVWKAPANTSLSYVIGPTVQITADQQETLNIDPISGKSINAIRAFTGKGTLVWGARTLAGNDNEWRYVNVRRLFIMIEESAKLSTAFAVFEANDASTWLKVKGMLESYLYGLWEQGALQGSKPEQAFYVNVGLGKTMTAQDILEGRMIVEIGIAAVRPAEFIVLRFSHKLPEA